MKRKLKYLLMSLFIVSLSPMVVDAASISLEGTKNDNTAEYNLIYTADETPSDQSVKLEINKTNDDLIYSFVINKDSGVIGEASCNELVCSQLNFQNVPTGTVIGTLTITNNVEENKETEIVVKLDDVETAKKSFTVSKIIVTTEPITTQPPSNDASLSSINLSVGNIDQAFVKDIMEYTVTGIKDTVNSITLTPNCDNNCSWAITCPTGGCSISNTRRVTLANGANKVAVNVTSEDGSANKTYILNIYRGEIVASSAYLSELEINDGTITPNFDSMTNDYTVTVGLDIEKLDIITTTEDPSAEVLIKGNENLQEGENTVTITVTSSDGENKQVYTILVNKEALEEEEEKEEDKEEVVTTPVKKKTNNTWLIILLSVLGLGLIIVVFLIIFKKKKKKNKDNDKNNPNKPNGPTKEEKENLTNTIEMENTESLNILNETTRSMSDEPKQDIDEALDDLMQTKRLELGDLNF